MSSHHNTSSIILTKFDGLESRFDVKKVGKMLKQKIGINPTVTEPT